MIMSACAQELEFPESMVSGQKAEDVEQLVPGLALIDSVDDDVKGLHTGYLETRVNSGQQLGNTRITSLFETLVNSVRNHPTFRQS
jgi:hypothetical protein